MFVYAQKKFDKYVFILKIYRNKKKYVFIFCRVRFLACAPLRPCADTTLTLLMPINASKACFCFNMELFVLHEGHLCKCSDDDHDKDNTVAPKRKVDLSSMHHARQQRVVQTLNERKEELKVVKYANSKWKVYYIANHAYLERLESGRLVVHDLPPLCFPVSPLHHLSCIHAC